MRLDRPFIPFPSEFAWRQPAIRVLLADADPSVHVHIHDALAASDCRISSFDDGREAIRMISKGPAIEVAVTDVRLPPALDILRLVRSRNPRAATILTVPGEIDLRVRLEAQRLGAEIADWPADVARLRRLIGRARLRRLPILSRDLMRETRLLWTARLRRRRDERWYEP